MKLSYLLCRHAALLLAFAAPSFASSSSGENNHVLSERQATNRLVFAHFMIGIVGNRNSPADYDIDMQRAKAVGIDAFALNIGVDPYTDRQLELAYQSAANNGLKAFISFDFNWYRDTSDAVAVGNMIKKYGSKPAQLMVDGKIFASSFAGDGLDVAAMRAAAGSPVFWAPNIHPEYGTDFSKVDSALNWMAWPNDGNNKAPRPGASLSVKDGDDRYIKALAGKPYVAPVSPWFFTHFGPEVPYSKNWVFPGDLLWYDRWQEILKLGPRFIEIITWNDYGESHYIGPLSSSHYDDGNSKWVNDMPHNGWLEMAQPFIAAYRAGDTSPNRYITTDRLVYWYRPSKASVNCDATDTTMQPANNASGNYFNGRPNGWETMSDSVFVVSLLKQAGTITVTSGASITKTVEAPAGAYAFKVDMGVGTQQFRLARGGQTVLSAASRKVIIDGCVCGLYNFNPYVGTVPEGPDDPLLPEGLASLTAGLRVSTCRPTPSLPPAGGLVTFPPTTTSTTRGGGASTSSTTTTPTTTSSTTLRATTTTRPTTSTTPLPGAGCTRTVTTLTQLFPTNCLQAGDYWAGRPEVDDPDRCDGAKTCTP